MALLYDAVALPDCALALLYSAVALLAGSVALLARTVKLPLLFGFPYYLYRLIVPSKTSFKTQDNTDILKVGFAHTTSG